MEFSGTLALITYTAAIFALAVVISPHQFLAPFVPPPLSPSQIKIKNKIKADVFPGQRCVFFGVVPANSSTVCFTSVTSSLVFHPVPPFPPMMAFFWPVHLVVFVLTVHLLGIC